MTDISSVHKLRSWKHTLDSLAEETGISLREAAEYIDAAYNEDGVSFYVKIPRKRSVYIGIGMAFGQPVEVINEWISTYSDKRRLYAKDISEDLVWIYLINANIRDTAHSINYYLRYEEFQAVAYAVFRERWDEIILNYEDTSDVEVSLGQAEYGPEYDGIKSFVAEHMDAFKTAYARPRAYLDRFVGSILTACRTHPTLHTLRSLNSLRGYLDDSMINFLSGNSETIHVVDRRTGKRTVNIKHMPKSRKKYISLCLALGMTVDEINRYLDMMGYAPLDIMNEEEGILVSSLTEWERLHPLQRTFKQKFIEGNSSAQITEEEMHQSVEQMLHLRSDLAEYYGEHGYVFTYGNK